MSEIDNKIRDLESQLSSLYAERESRMGIKAGEYRTMSSELLAVLKSRAWWTDEIEPYYRHFKIHQISATEISIRGANGGITNVPTSLVMRCEKVIEIDA